MARPNSSVGDPGGGGRRAAALRRVALVGRRAGPALRALAGASGVATDARLAGPLLAAVLGAVAIGAGTGALLLALAVAAHLPGWLLARGPAPSAATGRVRPILVGLAGTAAEAGQVAVLWLFGPPELRVACVALAAVGAVRGTLDRRCIPTAAVAGAAVWAATLAALVLADLLAPAGASPAGLVAASAIAVLGPVLGRALAAILALDRAGRALARAAEAARDDALRASEARMRHFAVVSHELRTPLNGILGMTQGLLAGPLAPEQREKARVIAESGRTLTALLNDVLDLAKMEAGRLDLHARPESLHATLRHVVALYRPLAEEKSLALRLDLAPTVPDWLDHDGLRLRQGLSNLVANAIKFTAEGSVKMRVGARDLPDGRSEIVVAVEDTGIGLTPEAAARLFEPFEQGDPAIPQTYGGTGLGLAITRRLARLMGGDVTCAPRPGGGAVFTFAFRAAPAEAPFAAPEVHARPAALRETPGVPAPGLRVLVVDDVETNRAVARLFLEPVGIRVAEAASGREALDCLGFGGVDAVLLDLRMPGLSGEEVIAAIRAGEAGDPAIPVLAVTADHLAEMAALGAAGFDGLVIKPMDQRALQTALMSVLAARLVAPRARISAG